METATKKSKLISTILVLVFICIMIPVAIFANRNGYAGIKNDVAFSVEDIEGKFCYATFGNSSSNFDVGSKYEDSTLELKPQTLFVSDYTTDNDVKKIILKDASGNILVENNNNAILNFNAPGIHFDKTHTEVSMYFFFVNFGKNITATDNRAVNVSIQDNTTQTNYTDNDLTPSWQYTTGNTDDGFDGRWQSYNNSSWSTLNYTDEIKIGASPSANTYKYIIIKYTLTLSDDRANSDNYFGVEDDEVKIELAINLESDAI